MFLFRAGGNDMTSKAKKRMSVGALLTILVLAVSACGGTSNVAGFLTGWVVFLLIAVLN